MAKAAVQQPTAQQPPEKVESPLDPFYGVSFHTPAFQMFRLAIERYVQHSEGCGIDPCECGLSRSIQELKSREVNLIRYGSGE